MRKYATIPNFMIVTFGLVTIASLLSLVFSNNTFVQSIDTRMRSIADISIFGAMVFSATALWVSALAYKSAVQRPRLELKVRTLGGDKKLVIPVHPNTGKILNRHNLATWRFFLHNNGDATARYPVVKIQFVGAGFSTTQDGWNATEFSEEAGWYEFQSVLKTDLVIHPNFPIELPRMNFARCTLRKPDKSDSTKITILITVAADGFIEGPISEVVRLDYNLINCDMEEWILSKFRVVQNDVFVTDNISTDLEFLTGILGDEAPPKYEVISTLPIAIEGGWLKIFDEWKEKKLIT